DARGHESAVRTSDGHPYGKCRGRVEADRPGAAVRGRTANPDTQADEAKHMADDPQPEPAPGAAQGPLTGVLVADFSRVLAGPYATMLLADMGAEVVKVEGPQGDETRSWMPPV